MRRMPTLRDVVLATLCLTLVSCQWDSPGLVETQPETEAAGMLPKDIHWARNSAEHKASILQVYRLATQRVEELARDREPGTWAVSVDADETSIDNSIFEVEIWEASSYNEKTWHDWVTRQEATPQPGAIAFMSRVHELGGKVAIVTNRREKHCADTEAVFNRHGIPYDHIFCRPSDDRAKNPRWEMVEAGTSPAGWPPLEILVWLGDNIIDFPVGQGQEIRFEPEGAFQGFGDRFFIFPNPMYGSWEENPQD